MRDPAEVGPEPAAAQHSRRPGPAFLGVLVVELAWPKRELWPNGRPHWAGRHRVAKRYREDARLMTLVVLAGRTVEAGAVLVRCDFRPPVANKIGRRNTATPDQDNALAAIKSGLDGIADALGVNDRRFTIERPTIGERVVLGCVFVRLELTQ